VTSIGRDDFTRRLAASGGYLNVDRLPPDVRTTLRDVGITDADLSEVAGADHVIRGEAEFENLFRKIDARADRDGSSRTLGLTAADGTATGSGRAFEAIERVVTANRAVTDRTGGLRFASSTALDPVRAGTAVLESGSTGDGVRRVQQALVDMGYANPATMTMGTFDAETRHAVQRFQRDAGLRVDGGVGRETLGALAASAPPPGRVLDRSAEYDRLYADGRLDVTMALGFDEGGSHADAEREVLSGLRSRGFRPVTAADISAMSASDRTRLGLTAGRVDPNAQYFLRDDGAGGSADTVLRLITPGTDGARARASYARALEQDEVVIYSGHARYGTGPDFDAMSSGAGNFVIDGHGNREAHAPPAGLRSAIGRADRSDLRSLSTRPDYQLLVFNACSTEEYMHNLRDPGTFRRDMTNTDIISTTIPTRLATNGAHTLRFLDGVLGRESNRTMLGAQSRIEQDRLRSFGMDAEVPAAARTYSESGFLENSTNRFVTP
jgi:peptidoglycan hydrolase-like protein with peptidoglycan-binding domain